MLVPSGIATDDTTEEFFAELMDGKRLVSLYDFENRDKIFEDVDGRFKFFALVFGSIAKTTEQADFVFFAHSIDDTADRDRAGEACNRASQNCKSGRFIANDLVLAHWRKLVRRFRGPMFPIELATISAPKSIQ